MSMLPMSGGVHEMDMDVEFGFGPFDSEGPRMTVPLDPLLWRTLTFKKDLNLKTLRWFLLLHQLTLRSKTKDDECMV